MLFYPFITLFGLSLGWGGIRNQIMDQADRSRASHIKTLGLTPAAKAKDSGEMGQGAFGVLMHHDRRGLDLG